MSADGGREVLRDRLRAFLSFLRPKLLASGADLDRLSQLRRLSDVRVRQFAVGKPRVTGQDLCALLADAKTGRFDALADAAGLVRSAHLAAALEPLGEEMGLVVEGCLLIQVLGPAALGDHAKAFVAANGAAAAPAAPAAPRPAAAVLPAEIVRLLGPVKELWAPPAAVVRILQMLEAPDARPDVVGAEIEKDAALAARSLGVANAMGAGGGAPMASIKRAVVALGFPLTHRIVVIAALREHLGAGPEWAHPLRTAHLASLVARTAKAGHPDEHFAAGLLHELGAFVLRRHLPGREQALDPAVVGACVAERWRLPKAVVAAIRHHADPADVLEEIQLPREALVVAAACRLVRDGAPDAARWTPFLRVPAEKVGELQAEAARRAEATLREFA